MASTVKALESLLADETDSVVCPDGESFHLPRAQESLRKSEEAQRQTAELQRTIPAHLAVLDRNGEIIFINESWRRFLGRPEGHCEHLEIGQNYLQYCEVADHAFDGMGSKLAAGIRKVLQALHRNSRQDFRSFLYHQRSRQRDRARSLDRRRHRQELSGIH